MNNRQIIKLSNIIRGCDFADFPTDDDQENARQALILFCKALKKLKPEREYNCGNSYRHCSYVINMIPLYISLRKGDYCNTCHELESLIRYETILQARVYHNLIYALSNYLGE